MSDTPLKVPTHLPAHPSLTQLRKLAKQRLAHLRLDGPETGLAAAQHTLARDYGFPSWSQLVQHVAARESAPGTPRISLPVSRHLGARDVNATARFWCDVLGFSIAECPEEALTGADGETESDELEDRAAVVLTAGEARIYLHRDDWAPDFSGGPRPPGSAIILLPVSDLAAMHERIAERGGQPGAIAKVNWLKLEVFEVRDPDGHTIWFAQSYQRDMMSRPVRMVTQAIPELPFSDVAAAVAYYRDVLGFSVNYAQHDLGVMDRDSARVLLIARPGAHVASASAFFYVRDADELYAELLQAGADIESEPVSQPWGMREFSVRDREGNRLTFAQTFE